MEDEEEDATGFDFDSGHNIGSLSMTKETYKDQLKDVLGSDHEEDGEEHVDDDELEEKEVERSLTHEHGHAEGDISMLSGSESFVSSQALRALEACFPPVLRAID